MVRMKVMELQRGHELQSPAWKAYVGPICPAQLTLKAGFGLNWNYNPITSLKAKTSFVFLKCL